MRFSLAFFCCLLLCLPACQPQPRVEPENLFWPLPPDRPRVQYVKSIYSEEDIGRVYNFREILFGKTYVDRLARPYGVFARSSRIYATDIGAMRVMVYDLTLKRVASIGGDGSLQVPASVIADSKGTVYVADPSQARINMYDSQGKYLTAYLLGNARPVALALNETLGRLYVLDRNDGKVTVLNAAGDVLFAFGSPGTEDGQFNMPLGLALDAQGNVYVLDSGNFRVQIFSPDGKFLNKFGSVGDRPGYFSNPKGIAVDSEGHVYVTDAAFSNFQIFDTQGRILLFVGRLGIGPGQMYLPAGISIDEHDKIYIADQLNSRIEVFQYLKEP